MFSPSRTYSVVRYEHMQKTNKKRGEMDNFEFRSLYLQKWKYYNWLNLIGSTEQCLLYFMKKKIHFYNDFI